MLQEAESYQLLDFVYLDRPFVKIEHAEVQIKNIDSIKVALDVSLCSVLFNDTGNESNYIMVSNQYTHSSSVIMQRGMPSFV